MTDYLAGRHLEHRGERLVHVFQAPVRGDDEVQVGRGREQGVEQARVALAVGRIAFERLRQGLVDGLVEAGDIFAAPVWEVGLVVGPQAQHARAQGAVFGHGVVDTEALEQARRAVQGRLARVARARGRLALALLVLLLGRLARFEVGGDGVEDAGGMVAQGLSVLLARRRDVARETLPFVEDGFHLGADEIGKRHGRAPGVGGLVRWHGGHRGAQRGCSASRACSASAVSGLL
nr:hypothetical protein [Massilia glaciei]